MVLGLAQQLAEPKVAAAKGSVVQRGDEIVGGDMARARCRAQHTLRCENARDRTVEPSIGGDGAEADPFARREARGIEITRSKRSPRA